MMIYFASPRMDRLSVMLEYSKNILCSFYYIDIEQRMLMSEAEPLKRIIEYNQERTADETKKRRTPPST